MTTAKDLVAFCESKLGTAYVYGMKGTVMTEADYDSLKKLYPTYVPDSDRAKIGQVCVDCSGLISWCTGIVYSSTDLYNHAVSRNPISSVNTAPVGAILWKQGHCGVYIGDNQCIEAKGSEFGTIKTPVTGTGANTWTNWMTMSYIDYTVEPQTPTPENVYARMMKSAYPDIINSPDYWLACMKGEQIASANNIMWLISRLLEASGR